MRKVGRGFKHPSSPRLELQTQTTNFIAEYPFLQQDQGYIDFLEFYAGASFNYPNGDYLDMAF